MAAQELSPQFSPGDRVFSHYTQSWGTVHDGGDVNGGDTWYEVRFDDDRHFIMNDGNGVWDVARIVPPRIAQRYGYGGDPKAA